MTARKLDLYLSSSNDLRRLADEARRIAEVQQVFLRTAPKSLAHACRVKRLRAGILVLLAENAAIAAKLKQLLPRLLASYRKLGWQVTSIRIEVQVREAPRRPATILRPKRLSLESIENLDRLASGLEDSPLKQALTDMVAHQRSKSN